MAKITTKKFIIESSEFTSKASGQVFKQAKISINKNGVPGFHIKVFSNNIGQLIEALKEFQLKELAEQNA